MNVSSEIPLTLLTLTVNIPSIPANNPSKPSKVMFAEGGSSAKTAWGYKKTPQREFKSKETQTTADSIL